MDASSAWRYEFHIWQTLLIFIFSVEANSRGSNGI
jgi:hypothetical protein